MSYTPMILPSQGPGERGGLNWAEKKTLDAVRDVNISRIHVRGADALATTAMHLAAQQEEAARLVNPDNDPMLSGRCQVYMASFDGVVASAFNRMARAFKVEPKKGW